MNCHYCGYFHENPTDACGRCGAEMPDPTCQQCGTEVEWGEVLCDQCRQMSRSADKTPCPSCGSLNNVSAEYCTSCGTPMAVITQVTELARANDRDALETWRVYGIETDIVGREDELAELESWLDDAFASNARRVVGITGDTGFGKSRLLSEFQQQAEQAFAESVVLESAGRENASGPYGLFERLFKNRYYIGEDEAPGTARRKFKEAVASIVDDGRADRVADLVGHAIGIPFDDSPYISDEQDVSGSTELDRNSVEAMAELLRADARSNPLLVLLEDLQYEQPQSIRALGHLIDETAGVPILFLLSWNPKEVLDGALTDELPLDSRIQLRPLSDEEVEQFVRQTLHKVDELPDDLVERIVEAAHGVPLSVEEMLRILIGEGVIDTRQEPWTVDEDHVDDVQLPTTVEDTVRARLEALSDDERRILEMGACVGDEFWPELIRALYHLYSDYEEKAGNYWFDEEVDPRVDELLESLERKDMIRESDEPGFGGYDQLNFKHRIEREAVYGEIPGQTKQRYHRLIAQWLEREVPEDELDRLAERIARQYDEGHCLEDAAAMYVRAGEYAAERFANDKAVDLFTKGLGYLSDADIDQKLSAFHDLGSVYVRRGEYDQALAYFREMLRYSWMINDSGKGGAALNKIGRAYRSLGEYDEALEHFDRALDLFWDVSDLRGVASTLDDIGKIHWIRGEYDEALRYYTGGLELRRDIGDRRSIAVSLSNLGSLKFQRGDFEAALEYYQEALELRRAIDDRQGVADSYNTLGAVRVERGDPKQALELFEEALAIARDVGHKFMEASYRNNIGEAHLRAGQLGEAAEHLEDARRVAESAGDKRVLFDTLRNLGRVALERESYQLARERIQKALEIARSLESEVLLGTGHLALADVYADWCHSGGGDAMQEDAEQNYRAAIARLREVGNRAKLGRALSRFGHFLLDRGETDRGRAQLEQASEIFDDLELPELQAETERAIRRM